MERVRTAILISGRGSNMQSLIAACRSPAYPAEIVTVISSRPDAPGLARAREAGIAAVALDRRAYPGREAFEQAIEEALARDRIGIVCLAGFMRLLSDGFVARWRDRLLNIHPSLLPAFKGLDVHERVLAAGARFSGCTVHFVRPAMDEGPIIVQAAVPVLPDDDSGSLAARVLAAEHRCYPLALDLVASGRTRVVAERVEIEGAISPADALLNPSPD